MNAPAYNDQSLNELCGYCHKRLGQHSVHNHCPVLQSNGEIHRDWNKRDFTEQEFRPTGRYQEPEAI